MATFKVTIDENSELGIHIGKLSPRGRSREIYMLACLGLMNKGVGSNSYPNSERVLSVDGVLDTEVSKREKRPEKEKISDNNQLGIIDYGDELMDL